MSLKYVLNHFTGKFDAIQELLETIAFNDLSDMPGGYINVGGIDTTGISSTGQIGAPNISLSQASNQLIFGSPPSHGYISYDAAADTYSFLNYGVSSDTAAGIVVGAITATSLDAGSGAITTTGTVDVGESGGRFCMGASGYMYASTGQVTIGGEYGGGDVDAMSFDVGAGTPNIILWGPITMSGSGVLANISTTGTAFLGLIDLGTNTIDDGTMSGNWDFGSGTLDTTGDITTTGTAFLGLIDLGTNTIDDGAMTGNWGFGAGTLTTTGTAFLGLIDLGTNTIDDTAMTGNWDMNASIITDVRSLQVKEATYGNSTEVRARTGVSSTDNFILNIGSWDDEASLVVQYREAHGLYARVSQDVTPWGSPEFTGLTVNGNVAFGVLDLTGSWNGGDIVLDAQGKDGPQGYPGNVINGDSINLICGNGGPCYATKAGNGGILTAQFGLGGADLGGGSAGDEGYFILQSSSGSVLKVDSTMALLSIPLYFTQTDGNEYIDSLADGYLDIGATTALRLKPVTIAEDAIYFTQTDGNEKIDSLADGYMDYRATTAHRFGDGTNQAVFAADGELTLAGTARITKSIWLGVQGIKAPGTKPATFKEWGISGVWEFSDGTDDTVIANLKFPEDMDRSVAPTFTVGWSTNTAVTTETCTWQIEYLYTQAGEDVTAAAQETLTVDSNAIAQANGLIVATITGLDVPNAADVCMHCRIKRLGAGGNDDLTDTAEMSGVCLSYTACRLGTAL